MNQENSKISAVVIAKNEAVRITACLDSLSWCDEIIVVNNSSRDDTANLAKQKGAYVFNDGSHSFAKLRNLGKEKSKYDWLLYLDADEIITPAMRLEIQIILKTGEPINKPSAYYFWRKNYYLGKIWPYQDKIQRLFWKPHLVDWRGDLHETPIIKGQFGILPGYILHNSHRTLAGMVNKTNEWSAVEADLRYKKKHPRVVWWRLLRVMGTGFTDSFIRQGGWKAGTYGFIESIYQGFSLFITYAKLWELQNNAKNIS